VAARFGVSPLCFGALAGQAMSSFPHLHDRNRVVCRDRRREIELSRSPEQQ
jgi:hypothetical protein